MVIDTLPKKRQKDEDFAFDETFSVENNDQKRTVERRKLIFKTKSALVPKTNV